MRDITKNESKWVNGSGVDILIPVPTQTEGGFLNGFNSGVNLVGSLLGIVIGIPAAIVILPCRAIYTVAGTVITGITSVVNNSSN